MSYDAMSFLDGLFAPVAAIVNPPARLAANVAWGTDDELAPADLGEPAAQVCRCGSSAWRDVPIHSGQSVRRDCHQCGRFIGFPVWYGLLNAD